jgi:hypothetical protein
MDQLQQYASKYPKSKLRIICISDGEDNKSNRLVHEIAAQLVGYNIVVDSFCLGKLHSLIMVNLLTDLAQATQRIQHSRLCHT